VSKIDKYFLRPEWSNSSLGNVKSILSGGGLFKCSAETLEFGSQVHEAILEPAKYYHNMASDASYTRNFHKVNAMMRAGANNPVLKMFLDNPKTEYEKEVYFTAAGLECRMKADLVCGSIVGDIKTTDATSRQEFEARALEYGYNRQGAFYLDGTGCKKFIIFAIAKKYPHPTFTYVLNHDDPKITAGRAEYLALLEATRQLTPEQLTLLTRKS